MANDYFQFKQFTVQQARSAMKVTTDSCLFGAWCANEIKNDGADQHRLLDIGAGTGLLSLMVAQKNKVKIDAVELEAGAANEAQDNVSVSPFRDQITVIQSDISTFSGGDYDIIISNPPFYESEWESPVKERNTAHHSHHLKWTDLFPIIRRKLQSGGTAYLLLPNSRVELANDLIATGGMHINKEILVLHREGRSPFRRMLKISFEKKEALISELLIHDETGGYSQEFVSYLREYYLYL